MPQRPLSIGTFAHAAVSARDENASLVLSGEGEFKGRRVNVVPQRPDNKAMRIRARPLSEPSRPLSGLKLPGAPSRTKAVSLMLRIRS